MFEKIKTFMMQEKAATAYIMFFIIGLPMLYFKMQYKSILLLAVFCLIAGDLHTFLGYTEKWQHNRYYKLFKWLLKYAIGIGVTFFSIVMTNNSIYHLIGENPEKYSHAWAAINLIFIPILWIGVVLSILFALSLIFSLLLPLLPTIAVEKSKTALFARFVGLIVAIGFLFQSYNNIVYLKLDFLVKEVFVKTAFFNNQIREGSLRCSNIDENASILFTEDKDKVIVLDSITNNEILYTHELCK